MAFGWLRNFLNNNVKSTPDGGWFYPIGMAHSIYNGGTRFDDFQENALLFTCISKYAKYTPHVNYIFKKDDKVIQNDPLAIRMNNPNNTQTGRQFIKAATILKKLNGVANINVIAGESFMLDPSRAGLIVLPELEVKDHLTYDFRDLELNPEKLDNVMFCYRTEQGVTIDIPYSELILIVDEIQTPTNPFRYVSASRAASLINGNYQQRLEADNVLTGKPGGLGIVSSQIQNVNGIGIPLQKQEKDDIEKRLQNNYGVGRGKSAMLVSSASLQYQAIAQTIKNFQIPELTELDYSRAANVWGIEKELLIGTAKYDQKRAAEIAFIQGPVTDTAQDIIDGILKKFKYDEKGITAVASFDHMPIMFENKKNYANYINTTIDAYTKAAALGFDPNIIQERLKELI